MEVGLHFLQFPDDPSASIGELSLKLASHLKHPVNWKPPKTWSHSRPATSDRQGEEKAWWVLVVACRVWVLLVAWFLFKGLQATLRHIQGRELRSWAINTVNTQESRRYAVARAYIFCSLVPWRRHYVLFGERLSVGVLLLIKWHIYAPSIQDVEYFYGYLFISFIINSSPEM